MTGKGESAKRAARRCPRLVALVSEDALSPQELRWVMELYAAMVAARLRAESGEGRARGKEAKER